MNGFRFGFCALALALAVGAAAELRVVESGPQYLRLVYEPDGPELERGRGTLVGLPPDGEIRLELIEARVVRTDRADEDAGALTHLRLDHRRRVVPLLLCRWCCLRPARSRRPRTCGLACRRARC